MSKVEILAKNSQGKVDKTASRKIAIALETWSDLFEVAKQAKEAGFYYPDLAEKAKAALEKVGVK